MDSYLPSPKSAAKHFYDLARALADLGHEPTVLTCSELVPGPHQLTVEDSIRVLRVRTPVMKSPSRVLRALREVRLPFVAWRRAQKELAGMQCDLIVFYSPTIFWGPLVWRLKKLFRAPAYLYLRDIFPQWALDAGILRKGPAYYFFRAVERFQYSVADVIALQAHGDRAHFDGDDNSQGKLEVIYNWGPADEGPLPVLDFRSKLGLKDKTVFFFGGTFGVAQNMDAILDLARGVRHDDSIRILLAGDGTETARLKKTIEQERLENVVMLPPLAQRDYMALVSEIDVGIVSLARELRTHNVPGKSLSYAHFSKPVLASLNPGTEFGDLVREFEAGFASDAGDTARLVQNALQLAGDIELRKRMGANNRRLYDTKFNLQTAIDSLMRAIARAAA